MNYYNRHVLDNDNTTFQLLRLKPLTCCLLEFWNLQIWIKNRS
jgi:hypothetical protein